MGNTTIEWTNKTWSPLRARVRTDAGEIAKAKGYASLVHIAKKMAGHVGPHCEHVSGGCLNCYSGTNNHRRLPKNGTGLPFDRRSRDLIESIVDEKILSQPLNWKTSQRVFVENQSDLFGEWVTGEMIERVFAVMALCPKHTFQILTKRAKPMLEYLRNDLNQVGAMMAEDVLMQSLHGVGTMGHEWPLPNVHLGVSVEDQKTADERIPLLLQTPAAKRFVSYEPALGAVNFRWLGKEGCEISSLDGVGTRGDKIIQLPKLNQIIVGGESGPCARPFDIAWARQTIAQCKAAGVACFVKQLGAKPFLCREADGAFIPDYEYAFKDRKGGDMDEWPEDLRIRELI